MSILYEKSMNTSVEFKGKSHLLLRQEVSEVDTSFVIMMSNL